MRTCVFKLAVLITLSICTLFEYASAQGKPLTDENKKTGLIANEETISGNDDSIKNFWPEILETSYLGEDDCELSDELGPISYEADSFQIYTSDHPGIKYDKKSQIFIFRSKADCEDSDISNSVSWRPYSPIDLSDPKFTVNVCSWAKIVKGGSDMSICVQGKLIDDKLDFPVESNQIEGKRLVIVVARAGSFDEDGSGFEIQSAILEWLKEIKKENIRIPLNLLTIDGDGKVRQVLRGEELNSLPIASNEENPPLNIEGVIGEKVTFYSDGYRPLKDLEFVERRLYELGILSIDKVLYVTDGQLPEKIFNAELGTTLGWKADGVELYVVTRGLCSPWIKRSRVPRSRCVSIKTRKDIKAFKMYLSEFKSSTKNVSNFQTSD